MSHKLSGALTREGVMSAVQTAQTQIHLTGKHVSNYGEGLNEDSNDDNDSSNLIFVKDLPYAS